MKKLFEHIYACYLLWKMGFFFSTSVAHSKYDDGVQEIWGFLRLNHAKEKIKYGVADIDFSIRNEKTVFVSMKADNDQLTKVTFRYDSLENE